LDDNHLASDLLGIGQRLTIKRPFAATATAEPIWRSALKSPGPVLRPFGAYKAGGVLMRRTGVELTAIAGTTVFSPAPGVVRYSGQLEGMGHLLILEHSGGYATVMGPCDPQSLLVSVGQAVVRGQALGYSLPADQVAKPYVHLELRHHEKAVDPARIYADLSNHLSDHLTNQEHH